MRLFANLIVIVRIVEMVSGSWQFPPSQLNQQERFQAHSPQKELSRRGRSLHQELFLSREAQNVDDDESNTISPSPPFSRILEHSWQAEEAGDSICSSEFVPNICMCSSGWSKHNFLSYPYLCWQWRFPALVHQTLDASHLN